MQKKIDDLPSRPDIEKSMLGSILIDGGLFLQVSDVIEPGDFFVEAHRLIYLACLGLSESNIGIDSLTVLNVLERDGVLEKAGGTAYVSSLMDLVPDVSNIDHYAHIVHDVAIRRKLIERTSRVPHEARRMESIDQVIENAQRDIGELITTRGGFVRIDDVVLQNEQEIKELRSKGGALTGIPTGFRNLDTLTQGLQKTDFIIVAARPGMGKSALALNIMANLTMHSQEEYVVGFFSLEMSAQQVAYRIQCSEAKVNLMRLRDGRLSRDDQRNLFEANGRMQGIKLFVDDTAANTVPAMRARATRLMQTEGRLDCIFIDHMQLIGSKSRVENRTQEIAVYSRGLKALAKELKVPLVCISQLSRRVEQRGTDKEPQLSDLRDSGAIEQDADVIIFLNRDEYYDPETERKGEADVILAKQRNGPTDRFVLAWSGELTRFFDLAVIEEKNAVRS